MKKVIIPNIITSANFVSGLFAVYFAIINPNNLYIPALLIILSSIFDFFDGFIARLLKVTSEFGKQLDSFADALSFGIVPAFIMFQLIKNIPNTSDFIPYISFIIALFSVFRLAIFNITDQKYEFLGLPTPAFAILIASLPLSLKWNNFFFNLHFLNELFSNIIFLVTITVFFSFLLISKIKMIALKFLNYSFKNNILKYTLIFISFILIILFQFYGLFFTILLYVIFSIVTNYKNKKKICNFEN